MYHIAIGFFPELPKNAFHKHIKQILIHPVSVLWIRIESDPADPDQYQCQAYEKVDIAGTIFDADPNPDLDRHQHGNPDRHQIDAIHKIALYQRDK